jgi:monothiol glutaredoxin
MIFSIETLIHLFLLLLLITVDVLADEGIRSGVKEFSQWPTIPQLYVCGEFIGGSDIMIEMYQSGELGEMIEKARADMV